MTSVDSEKSKNVYFMGTILKWAILTTFLDFSEPRVVTERGAKDLKCTGLCPLPREQDREKQFLQIVLIFRSVLLLNLLHILK